MSNNRDSIPTRTIISPAVAARLIKCQRLGPRRCSRWRGQKICGPSLRVRLTMEPYPPATVDAVVAELPRGIEAQTIIGADCLVPTVRRS
ncbi:MAG: hypothetical protein V2A73_20505 [Pseudomonadota bacterium]